MELKNYIFIVIFFASFAFLFFSLRKKIGFLKLGKETARNDNIKKRFMNVLKIAILQQKLVREKIAGYTHVIIFFAFLSPKRISLLASLSD